MGMSAVVDDAHQPRAIVAVSLVPPAPDLLGWSQLGGGLALITEPPPRVITSVSEKIGTQIFCTNMTHATYLSFELYSRFLTSVVYSLETRELLPGSGQNTVEEHCSQESGYTNSPESEQLT